MPGAFPLFLITMEKEKYTFLEYLKHRVGRADTKAIMCRVIEVVEAEMATLEALGSCDKIVIHLRERVMKRHRYLIADLTNHYRVYCKRNGYEYEPSEVEKIRMAFERGKE